MGYKYYDTPEGQDCFPKMFYTMKQATLFGLGASVVDVVLMSHPKGYFETAARCAYVTLPFTAMAASFTAATCLSTNIRRKDDHWNYVVGACAAASVVGAWRRSIGTGFLAAAVFSIAGVLKKNSIEDGWVFFPQVPDKKTRSFRVAMSNHSLTKERPRDWKMSEDE